jgi:hypothetical protein
MKKMSKGQKKVGKVMKEFKKVNFTVENQEKL